MHHSSDHELWTSLQTYKIRQVVAVDCFLSQIQLLFRYRESYGFGSGLWRCCGAVSRIEGASEQLDFDLALDVNTEIYELKIGNKFTLALALTLSLDGAPDEGQFDQVWQTTRELV